MLFPRFPTQRRHAATAGLLAIVGGLWLGGFAAEAEASCGDYLAFGHAAMPDARGTLPGRDLHDGPSPLHKPCQGPHCSSKEKPTATLNVVVRVSHDPTWACLAGESGLTPFPPSAPTAGESLLAPQWTSSELLRPPRARSV